MMKSRWFLTGLLMVLVGCNSEPTPLPLPTSTSSSKQTAATQTPASPTSSPTPIESPSPPTSKTATSTASKPSSARVSKTATPASSKTLSPPASGAFTISPQGIGLAKVGMTLGQLKQVLDGKAEFKIKSPFIVDFDAIAVIQGGKEQFYILYPAQLPLADSDIIEALVTDNPNYRTAEGVGPGTPIQQAEAVYGDATLSYNSLNESREYIKFAKLTSRAIAFRAKAQQDRQFAGVYPSSKTESKQTKDFEKTATIGLVEVYCRNNCPLPSP